MIYGYARVSTTEQNIEPQVAALRAAGCGRIMEEKASGAKDDRAVLARVLAYAVRGDSIVVTKLDRIARSTAHLLRIVEQMDNKGVAFKTLNAQIDTGSPTGKLMITMLGAIAEFERTMMLERQRDGIAAARLAGKYKGREPVARRQAGKILAGIAAGRTPKQMAAECEVGIASVYRIMVADRKQAGREPGEWLDGELPLSGPEQAACSGAK